MPRPQCVGQLLLQALLQPDTGGQDSNIGHALMAERPADPHQTQGELLMTRLIALLLIVGTAALAACNTVAGAGQDLSKGGNAITNSADKHNAE